MAIGGGGGPWEWAGSEGEMGAFADAEEGGGDVCAELVVGACAWAAG